MISWIKLQKSRLQSWYQDSSFKSLNLKTQVSKVLFLALLSRLNSWIFNRSQNVDAGPAKQKSPRSRPRQSVRNSWSKILKSSCSVKFKFWWLLSFSDISVLVNFQFYWHFGFSHISVVLTFQLCWLFSFGYIFVVRF